LAYELEPGERCRLRGSFKVDGQHAFAPGAEVVIETIDSDRDRPGFKYMVFSARLGKRVRLRGADLQRLFCKKCGADLDPKKLNCPLFSWVPPPRRCMTLTGPSRPSCRVVLTGGELENSTIDNKAKPGALYGLPALIRVPCAEGPLPASRLK